MFNTIYIFHSDGRGVWIPGCPLWHHDRALLDWCLHQSHYLKKIPLQQYFVFFFLRFCLLLTRDSTGRVQQSGECTLLTLCGFSVQVATGENKSCYSECSRKHVEQSAAATEERDVTREKHGSFSKSRNVTLGHCSLHPIYVSLNGLFQAAVSESHS